VATALSTLLALPAVTLAPHATPVDDLARFRRALGPGAPRVLIKRDDLLSFGGGGNKVRKLPLVLAEAQAEAADLLITCGGVQSNHARATAAAGAALGLEVVLVVNGPRQESPTANARLDRLFGATVHHVAGREDRAPVMARIAAEARAAGRRPYIVPLGASTATGALGFARGVVELASAGVQPDVIVHASSSGGTHAGLIVGASLVGLRARILGVSADESAAALSVVVSRLVGECADRLRARPETAGCGRDVLVDDTQVGGGYGVPTASSTEALELVARREGILLDPVYTAKAMAALIARVRAGEWGPETTVLFWHTGGQVGFFA
jgi:1-aminocyclopropane-1-carboxylate deaminase/D-cysteine desulfhydrase-like pyridoxal-dependent ACC family enzyme